MFQGLNDKINQLWTKTGLTLEVADFAPNTMPDLVQSFSGSSIKVYSGGSDKTIYVDPMVNYKFRALHDLTHLKLQADFNLHGETLVALEQMKDFSGFEQIIWAEIVEQVKHFNATGEFPEDQVKFIQNFLK